ncbi:hypothetical protein SESBI_27855 [Sesbania bispinosa]|nr:hypothetical protein SESBI_27855 [Sesbania bispinosa]
MYHQAMVSGESSQAPSVQLTPEEALKNVKDFISGEVKDLKRSEWCDVMERNLDYLSNLSSHDGISNEMAALISETSRKFTKWREDYNEARTKIKSTKSELKRLADLEASLETNKKLHREVCFLERQLLHDLTCMEKRIKDLEGKVNGINASMSACQLEKNIAVERKRDIFEEDNTYNSKR